MIHFPKPRILVSKCLGFDNCRYDGSIIKHEIVESMKEAVEFLPICPELAIGLGVPRQPVHILQDKQGKLHLVQRATGMDFTADLHRFAQGLFENLEVQGFIFKAKSPSCGIKDVPIHAPQGNILRHGNGLFADQAIARFPHLAAESEKRLENLSIYEHFLTKIFAYSELEQVKKQASPRALVNFHSRYKLLLMAYDQNEAKILGQIVANREKKDLASLLQQYQLHFNQALKRGIKRKAASNVLYHTLGYFKTKITAREKQLFLQLMEQFRQGKLPFSALTTLIRSWIERYEEPYLASQALFAPYPESLKREYEHDVLPLRDYWK